jgi:hypothetical protein
MENRNGLVVKARLTEASGYAERDAASEMVAELPEGGRITLGTDRGSTNPGGWCPVFVIAGASGLRSQRTEPMREIALGEAKRGPRWGREQRLATVFARVGTRYRRIYGWGQVGPLMNTKRIKTGPAAADADRNPLGPHCRGRPPSSCGFDYSPLDLDGVANASLLRYRGEDGFKSGFISATSTARGSTSGVRAGARCCVR